MAPDAIIVCSAGTVSYEEGGQMRWRTTTYDDRDAFGTLGGHDRVEATALLAKQYPDTFLAATSKVYADELHALGVEQGRIVQKENVSNTQTAIVVALRLAQEKGWKNLLFVSSEYHLPRIKAFYEQAKSDIRTAFVSSESILAKNDPAFVERFEKVKKTPAYQTRLTAEARGVEAIKKGTYRPAPTEDKKERPA